MSIEHEFNMNEYNVLYGCMVLFQQVQEQEPTTYLNSVPTYTKNVRRNAVL